MHPVKTDWFFFNGGVVADKLKRQWFEGFTLVLETNCIRPLGRELAQIIV